MLFGIIKSKKEKAQEEYKNLLYKNINYVKQYLEDMKHKYDEETIPDFMVTLKALREFKKLNKGIEDFIGQIEIAACRTHNACFLCDDAKTPENIYLANDLKELYLKFYNDSIDIEIPYY